MTTDTVLFLPKDLAALDQIIASLKNTLKTAGHEAGDLAHQSSETWHDNYGFEEADRERKRINGRLKELQAIRARAEIVEKQATPDRVCLGSTVTLHYTETDTHQTVIVGSYMVLDKIDPQEFSYAAPLIAPLLGATLGETKVIEIHGAISHVRIVSVA